MVERETRCARPCLDTRIVVRFLTVYSNNAERELSNSAWFETRCILCISHASPPPPTHPSTTPTPIARLELRFNKIWIRFSPNQNLSNNTLACSVLELGIRPMYWFYSPPATNHAKLDERPTILDSHSDVLKDFIDQKRDEKDVQRVWSDISVYNTINRAEIRRSCRWYTQSCQTHTQQNSDSGFQSGSVRIIFVSHFVGGENDGGHKARLRKTVLAQLSLGPEATRQIELSWSDVRDTCMSSRHFRPCAKSAKSLFFGALPVSDPLMIMYSKRFFFQAQSFRCEIQFQCCLPQRMIVLFSPYNLWFMKFSKFRFFGVEAVDQTGAHSSREFTCKAFGYSYPLRFMPKRHSGPNFSERIIVFSLFFSKLFKRERNSTYLFHCYHDGVWALGELKHQLQIIEHLMSLNEEEKGLQWM